jgi:hypothetical protein
MAGRRWRGRVIGFSMDGFDMLILGFMLAAISLDLALTNAQAGSLVTWTLMGAVAGGIITTFTTASPKTIRTSMSGAGFDLALRVVERYFGRKVAERTAIYIEHQGKGRIV